MQKEEVLTKQTAIDWLISQIEEGSATSKTYEFMYIKIPYNALKEAKVMEKEQIIKAAYEFMGTNFDSNIGRAQQYYNETYGGENEQD
jgi:hypothetical protein